MIVKFICASKEPGNGKKLLQASSCLHLFLFSYLSNYFNKVNVPNLLKHEDHFLIHKLYDTPSFLLRKLNLTFNYLERRVTMVIKMTLHW